MDNKYYRLDIRPAFSQKGKGFTLVELLVTIAIGTTLVMVAVPSFNLFQRNAQLSDAVSNYMTAVNLARANSMKQGLDSYLVPKDGNNWGSGWNVYTAATVLIGTTTGSITSGYIRFNGSGYPRLKNNGFGGATLEMRNGTRSSLIIIDQVGRVRSCITGTVGCPN